MARDLKEASKVFKKIRDDIPNLFEDALKEVGIHFLSAVIPLTPVEDNYTYEVQGKSYHVSGGALKRGWIGEVEGGSAPSPQEIESCVRNLRTGGFKITLANTVEYAMYVNYGHRQQVGRYVPAIGKRLTQPWVNGLKFKEMAENEIKPELGRIYNNVFERYKKKWNKL